MQVPCFLCLNILIYQQFRDILGMKFMAMGCELMANANLGLESEELKWSRWICCIWVLQSLSL